MKKIVLLIFISLLVVQAEDLDSLHKKQSVLKKEGSWFFYWGYNTSRYSANDIHLKGANYDYTLHNVDASDNPAELGSVYFTSASIPQFATKIGYFINDRESISFGTDHMKYVVDRPQQVVITGTDHQGNTHNGDSIELEGFIAFEHTDGLNYVNVAYEYNLPLWVNSSEEHALSLVFGPGVGVLFPRTNVTLYGHSDKKDAFKIAGFGVDGHAGLSFDFFTNYFFRADAKLGWINMPWISTSTDSADTASQSFAFVEYIAVLGVRF